MSLSDDLIKMHVNYEDYVLWYSYGQNRIRVCCPMTNYLWGPEHIGVLFYNQDGDTFIGRKIR